MARNLLRRNHRKISVGDLRDRITVSDRAITEPGFGAVNFGEDFPDCREVWAKVRTVNGRSVFTGADTDVAVTHEVTIRYDSEVTSESWFRLLDGTRLRIIDMEDPEERHEYLILQCTARGTDEASKA